jgi:hypothetical protein
MYLHRKGMLNNTTLIKAFVRPDLVLKYALRTVYSWKERKELDWKAAQAIERKSRAQIVADWNTFTTCPRNFSDGPLLSTRRKRVYRGHKGV